MLLLRALLLLSLLYQARTFTTFGSRRSCKKSQCSPLKASSFPDAVHRVADAVSSLQGETVVIKYGGNAMTSPDLAEGFASDVADLQKLGVRVVVVHGGGPQISQMLDKLQIESQWESGLRVSTEEVVEVAEMVLCGKVNKSISSNICKFGGRAVGLSGKDCSLLLCTKDMSKGVDIGNVGNVETVNTAFLNQLLDAGITPVISPIGIGTDLTTTYNVNADVAAGRVAGELKASRVLFLTDIAGVLNKDMELMSQLSTGQVQDLIDDETITGGMIPKVSFAVDAVNLGVQGAFITDGRVPHAVLNEVLSVNGKGSGQGGTIITL